MVVHAGNKVEAALEALVSRGRPRVWSLVVTTFGDLARGREDRISTRALLGILGPVGVKPAALRVALHRLRKDDWLSAERSGRSSYYRLAPHGRRQSIIASPRIYGFSPAPAGPWHLLLGDPSDRDAAANMGADLSAKGYFAVGPQAFLRNGGPAAHPGNCLALEASSANVPAWLSATLFPADLSQAYVWLERDLRRARACVTPDLPLSDAQAALLRTLVVHRWRRLILRHPDLPPDFHPPGWRGEQCRELVGQILDVLGKPALGRIEAEAAAR